MDVTQGSYAADEYMLDEGESAEGSYVQQQQQQQQQDQQPPSSPTASSTSLRSQPYKARTRTTVVCAECKRLKLRCDRQQPCAKCVQRDTASKCIYDPAADGKIDVHAVHKAQLSDRNLLHGIADAIGISEDERNIVSGAAAWPPYEGFKFTVDPARIRDWIGVESSGNPAGVSPGLGGLGGRSFPTESVPLVAFSKHPTQAPLETLPTRLGHIPMPVTAARRRHTAHQEDPRRISLGLPLARHMLDLASRTFQANSITIPTGSTNHLEMMCASMGWKPQAAFTCASVVQPPTSTSSSKAKEKEPARNIFRMAPKHSEIDFHDTPRPKDTLVMALAFKLFVMPSMEAASKVAATLTSGVPGSPSFGMSFSSLGLGPSPTPLPSPSLPRDKPPSAAGPASPTDSPRVPLPSQHAPLLVTPALVKRYLPPVPWRSRLWDEFESLMVTHDGLGGSGRVRWLRKRIDKMFEWADVASDADQGGPSQDASAAGESGSIYTASSHSSGHSSSHPRGSSTSKSRSSMDPQEIPPPPTLALFAVACAVFALGALSYECRKAYGAAESVAMDESGGANSLSSDGRAMPPPSLIPLPVAEPSSYTGLGFEMPVPTLPNQQMPRARDPTVQPAKSYAPMLPHMLPQLPEPVRSHALHSLSRACLFAHNALDLPSSLDYIYAHMLSWTYLLHPSDSLSSISSNGVRGLTGGTVAQVETTIWRELGTCVNVARSMGLNIVDEVATGSFGRAGEEQDGEDDAMSLWEREMRRRVWWMLSLFDMKISEYLGHSPLISLDPSSCKPPSDIDDACFDPTSTTLPSAVPGSANTTFFVLKCRLATLMTYQQQQTFRDPRTGELSKSAARAFDSRVAQWLGSMPDTFKIRFGETAAETDFPESDVVAAQACDLYIQASLMVIRLWHPFLVEAFAYPSLPESQNIMMTCASSAKAIILASQHVLNRFKSVRPLAFGYYGFGRAVYLAGTMLCSVLIADPKIIFASTAKQSVNSAIAVLRDPVVTGLPDGNGGEVSMEAFALGYMLNQVELSKDRLKPDASGKRKSTEANTIQPVRTGRPVLYAGFGAASVLGQLEFGLTPIRATPQAFTSNVISHSTDMTLDEDTRRRSTVLVPEASDSRPRVRLPQATRTETHVSPAPTPPPPSVITRQSTPNTTPPFPPFIAPSTKSKSRAASVASHVAASVASHVATSQLSQLSSQSPTSTSQGSTSSRGKPIFGIRNRRKPVKSEVDSNVSLARSDPPDAPSDPKRLKHDGRGSAVGSRVSRDGSSVSRDGSLPSPSRRMSQPLATYHPPPLGSPQMQPPIEQNAAPQPTYTRLPGRAIHSQGPSMSDAHPYTHPGHYLSDSAVAHASHQSKPSMPQWSSGHTVRPALPVAEAEARDRDSSATLDVEMVSQQVFDATPADPHPPSGTLSQQFQRHDVPLGYDLMSGGAIHQSPLGTGHNRSMEAQSPHAMVFSDSNQTIFAVSAGETQQPQLQMQTSLPQQQFNQQQLVHAQASQMSFQDHQAQSPQYTAPQYAMQQQQQSQRQAQEMMYPAQPQPQDPIQQYSMARHPSPHPQYQNASQYGAGPSMIQQEWATEVPSATSDVSHTQQIPPPPSWPNQQYPPAGGY